jgi:hypothetical protein
MSKAEEKSGVIKMCDECGQHRPTRVLQTDKRLLLVCDNCGLWARPPEWAINKTALRIKEKWSRI